MTDSPESVARAFVRAIRAESKQQCPRKCIEGAFFLMKKALGLLGFGIGPLRFCSNRQDVEGMAALMTPAHRFESIFTD
jgi:hypothetical protein